MKSWKDLTNFQRALIGVVIVIAAAVLPEIALLLTGSGAFAFSFFLPSMLLNGVLV